MKNRAPYVLTFLFSFIALILQAQLTMVVDQIPANTPAGATIYLAGSFNEWNPGNTEFALTIDAEGQYLITLAPPLGSIQFKFTRGSWATVEGNENGGFRPNRSFNYAGSVDTMYFQILSWEDLGGNQSTAAENVHILDDDFYLEELGRNRRVWIYLPLDYEISQKRYKVLYMQDGQNLFDLSTSFAGEWEVDETLNSLFDEGDEGCIVVGIENGGENRIDEYSPWENAEYGGGEGDAYLLSIIDSLKPYVDHNYRTKPEREYTGIMGSSMGGLISLYGGLKYDTTFSRIGSFSTSLWFAKNDAIDFIFNDPHEVPMRIYSVAGAMEGGNIADDAVGMDSLLRMLGYLDNEITTTIHEDGQHGEWFWAREFEAAYLWLWDGLTDVKTETLAHNIRIYPNPTKDTLKIEYDEGLQVKEIFILDINSRILRRFSTRKETISVEGLPGQLIIRVVLENGAEIVKKILHLRS
jgi:predicted alpha/beta superfamily hydrolase